jgi:DNA-binding Xre family transcriptional regulator
VSLYKHYYYTYFIEIIIKSQGARRGYAVIKYDRLWKTMEKKGITQYDLYTRHNVNRSVLDRLRHNKNIEMNTIDRLCNILQCNVEDIMEHIPDDNKF